MLWVASRRPSSVRIFRFEMEIIRKGAVEIALDVFLVVVAGGGHDFFHELVVEAMVAVQELVPAGIPKPRRPTELGRDSLSHEALDLGGLRWEAGRVRSWQSMLLQQLVPFCPAMGRIIAVRAFPRLILLQRDILGRFAKSIFVPCFISRNEGWRDGTRDNDSGLLSLV